MEDAICKPRIVMSDAIDRGLDAKAYNISIILASFLKNHRGLGGGWGYWLTTVTIRIFTTATLRIFNILSVIFCRIL